VGSGVRTGREAQIADMRAIADLFIATMTWTDMATRGDRLVLTRARVSWQQGFVAEVLGLIETDLDGRMAASILLDLEDIERATIARVFSQVNGDKVRAGKMLGISRATLYRKLKRYNIAARPEPTGPATLQ